MKNFEVSGRRTILLIIISAPLIVSLIPVANAFNSHFIKNFAAAAISFIVGFFTVFFSLYFRHQLKSNRFMYIFNCYIAASIVSSVVNQGVRRAVPELLVLCTVYIMLLALINLYPNSEDLMQMNFLAAAAILVMFGVSFLFDGGVRLTLFLYNANYLAAFLVILFPFVLAGLIANFNKDSIKNKVFYSLSAAAAVFLIFRTGSRAGVICSGAGGVLFLFFSMKQRKAGGLKITVLLSLVVAVAIIILFFVISFRVNLNTDGQNRSFILIDILGPRIPEWKSALQIWQSDRPLSIIFGRGPGSYNELSNSLFPSDFRLYVRDWNTGRSIMHAHNEILNHLAEKGVCGLLFWLMMVVRAVRRLLPLSWSRNADEPEISVFAAAVLSSVCSILLFSMVDATMGSVVIRMLFFLLLLLPELMLVQPDDVIIAEKRLRRGFPVIIFLFLICFTVWSSMFYFYEIKADKIFRTGVDESLKNNDQAALRFFEEAAELQPDETLYNYEQMKTLLRLGILGDAKVIGGEILKEVPGFRKTERLLAAIAIQQADYDQASRFLEQYLMRDAVEKGTYLQLISCYAVINSSEEAASAIDRLLFWTCMEALYYIDSYSELDSDSRQKLLIKLDNVRTEGTAAVVDYGEIVKVSERIVQSARINNFMSLYAIAAGEIAELLINTGFEPLALFFL